MALTTAQQYTPFYAQAAWLHGVYKWIKRRPISWPPLVFPSCQDIDHLLSKLPRCCRFSSPKWTAKQCIEQNMQPLCWNISSTLPRTALHRSHLISGCTLGSSNTLGCRTASDSPAMAVVVLVFPSPVQIAPHCAWLAHQTVGAFGCHGPFFPPWLQVRLFLY